MLDLFRVETDNQAQTLTAGLLALERDPTAPEQLESCMRAAHSLKGAARIVGLAPGVSLAHALEDGFVAAQQGLIRLSHDSIDLLLRAVDVLGRIAHAPEASLGDWEIERNPELQALIADLSGLRDGKAAPAPGTAPAVAPPAAPVTAAEVRAIPAAAATAAPADSNERVLRVTADNLNRLLGLTGESLVESRWLGPFAASLLRLKRRYHDLGTKLESLRETLPRQGLSTGAWELLGEVQQQTQDCQQQLSQRLVELETFDRRSSNLSHRLYDEALACRMRPFADGVRAYPRMVRDLARSLDKQVRLEIIGESTQVDRDILEKLDAPLGHLLRNAVDHGIDFPDDRRAAGKAAEGVIRLEARHSAAMLQIVVADDGRGIDPEKLRRTVVERKLHNEATARTLTEAELLEFLFLPGFTTRDAVTEISGRGVGLDVVRDMVKQVGGTVRIVSHPGQGTRFQLQLPLTLSVVRALLVDIGGEPYAFPLSHIVRTLKLPAGRVEHVEGRPHFSLDGRSIGLVSAGHLLDSGGAKPTGDEWPVVVIGERGGAYGLIVDRLIGERELVVQAIDARLGKVKDVASCALMADGSPVLIVDIEDVLRSVEKLVTSGRIEDVASTSTSAARRRKRVLVVDDSLTVRELERKLLDNSGYEVEIAVDGMDGWNAVRSGHFDLVVTDVDMPRMDGIELVRLIRKDAKLRTLPIMVVSYKDREEDRQRGLEAGADYYLTKSSFHDETLLQAVIDLIGEVEG